MKRIPDSSIPALIGVALIDSCFGTSILWDPSSSGLPVNNDYTLASPSWSEADSYTGLNPTAYTGHEIIPRDRELSLSVSSNQDIRARIREGDDSILGAGNGLQFYTVNALIPGDSITFEFRFDRPIYRLDINDPLYSGPLLNSKPTFGARINDPSGNYNTRIAMGDGNTLTLEVILADSTTFTGNEGLSRSGQDLNPDATALAAEEAAGEYIYYGSNTNPDVAAWSIGGSQYFPGGDFPGIVGYNATYEVLPGGEGFSAGTIFGFTIDGVSVPEPSINFIFTATLLLPLLARRR